MKQKPLVICAVLLVAFVICGVAALIISTVVGTSVVGNTLRNAYDNTRKQEVDVIVSSIELYIIDNGEIPTYEDGKLLPEVDISTVMVKGIDASKLDGIAPAYLARIPTDPDDENVEYQVGKLASGQVIVATVLSDDSIHYAISNSEL